MSYTIWVDVQGRLHDDVPPDNSIMLKLEKNLERLAKKLKVAKLSDSYDYSELDAEFANFADDDSGDGGEAEPPAGNWFAPDEALAAVRAIHEHLLKHPKDLGFKTTPSQSHWPGALMEELKHCQGVLEKAVSQGKQFRFLIVP